MKNIYQNYFDRAYDNKLTRISRFMGYGPAKLVAKFNSELNLLAKRTLSRKVPLDLWLPLVDLHTIRGFPKEEDRVFSDSVQAWLVDSQPVQVTKSEIKTELLRLLPGSLSDNETYFSWLHRRQNWTGPGSERHSRLFKNGTKVSSKLATALSANERKLRNITSRSEVFNEGLRAFVKPDERGVKGRYIVSAPFGVLTRMKYIQDWIERDLIMPEQMNLYNTFKSRFAKMRREGYHIPLDFSAFDYNIQRVFWDAWFEFLEELIPGNPEVSFLKGLMGSIPVRDTDGSIVGKWNKGMPSGFYWTAFLDSLFNLIACNIVFAGTKYSVNLVQGDDVDVLCADENVDLEELSSLFDYVGFEVNVQKNWFTPGITEFLKLIYSDRGADQYPARAYSTLMWAQPDLRNPPSERLFELATAWKEYFDRSKTWDENLMVRDLQKAVSNRFGLSRSKVKRWLHIPPIFGGFGLLPLELGWKAKVKSRKLRSVYSGNRFRRYPLEEIVEQSMSVYPININEILTIRNHNALPSQEAIFGKYPTWREHIEYVRAMHGLPNYTGYRALKDMSSVALRKRNMSDNYVGQFLQTEGRYTYYNYITSMAYLQEFLNPLTLESLLYK